MPGRSRPHGNGGDRTSGASDLWSRVGNGPGIAGGAGFWAPATEWEQPLRTPRG